MVLLSLLGLGLSWNSFLDLSLVSPLWPLMSPLLVSLGFCWVFVVALFSLLVSLGALLGCRGLSWSLFGALLACLGLSWSLLGLSCASLGLSGALLGFSLALLGHFWLPLGLSWASLGLSWEALGLP